MSETRKDPFQQVGDVASNIVERINPVAYAEYQLREAIADAREKCGDKRTREIFEREVA